jgi:hypothetical protein
MYQLLIINIDEFSGLVKISENINITATFLMNIECYFFRNPLKRMNIFIEIFTISIIEMVFIQNKIFKVRTNSSVYLFYNFCKECVFRNFLKTNEINTKREFY